MHAANQFRAKRDKAKSLKQLEYKSGTGSCSRAVEEETTKKQIGTIKPLLL
jgi:hypothetical protein